MVLTWMFSMRREKKRKEEGKGKERKGGERRERKGKGIGKA